MFEELLDTRKRVSGPNHQETVICMVNLAATLRGQHRFDEAETLLRDAIEIQRKSDRQSSQPTLAGLANLAGTLASQNRLDEAETAILEVLNTANKMNRSNHPNNLAAKVIHARIKERQGKYHEAEQLYSSALQEEKRVLSPDHPITQTTARRLIGVRYGVPQNWKKAAEEFGNLNRDIAENLYCQAISLLGDGDIEGYQRVRDEIETRFGNREDPSAQYIVVWTRVLQPIPVESAKSAVELAESLANIPPSDIHRIAMAATQVRCHKIPDGIDNLKKLNHEWETAEHKPASYSPATIRYFLALAFAKQADFEQARKWLDQANQQNAKESGARNAPVTWEVRLVNQLLQSEVEGMISAEN
jgi:tetratricopeptide (TPR) repeat protein